MIDFRRLAAPFAADELEWRLQQAGKKGDRIWALCVPYVTARALHLRLDEVCGPENWRNEFLPGPSGGIMCGISIKCDGEWVTKWDGAENKGQGDSEMAIKGGFSAAFKRAAVLWGCGRDLYSLDEVFAVISESGKNRGKTKEGDHFKWSPPELPRWYTDAVKASSGASGPQTQARQGESKGEPVPPHQRKMPIGTHNKGVPLGDISDKDLQSALDWCERTDAAKFADLVNDIRFVLASRTTPEPGPDMPPLPFEDER